MTGREGHSFVQEPRLRGNYRSSALTAAESSSSGFDYSFESMGTKIEI